MAAGATVAAADLHAFEAFLAGRLAEFLRRCERPRPSRHRRHADRRRRQPRPRRRSRAGRAVRRRTAGAGLRLRAPPPARSPRGRRRRACPRQAAGRRRRGPWRRCLPRRRPAPRRRARGRRRQARARRRDALRRPLGRQPSGPRPASSMWRSRFEPPELPSRRLAAPSEPLYMSATSAALSPRRSAHRLAVQDVALSRRKQGFDSPWARQPSLGRLGALRYLIVPATSGGWCRKTSTPRPSLRGPPAWPRRRRAPRRGT